jgi:hypothetical protein
MEAEKGEVSGSGQFTLSSNTKLFCRRLRAASRLVTQMASGICAGEQAAIKLTRKRLTRGLEIETDQATAMPALSEKAPRAVERGAPTTALQVVLGSIETRVYGFRLFLWTYQSEKQATDRSRRRRVSKPNGVPQFRLRERRQSAILSLCHPIRNTALAQFAPWCSCTMNIFADSSTLGSGPWRVQ